VPKRVKEGGKRGKKTHERSWRGGSALQPPASGAFRWFCTRSQEGTKLYNAEHLENMTFSRKISQTSALNQGKQSSPKKLAKRICSPATSLLRTSSSVLYSISKGTKLYTADQLKNMRIFRKRIPKRCTQQGETKLTKDERRSGKKGRNGTYQRSWQSGSALQPPASGAPPH
jgi:hypothetical protein